MINSPVWITSVSCSERDICFKECYSVDNPPADMQSMCAHIADVYITCGTYVWLIIIMTSA